MAPHLLFLKKSGLEKTLPLKYHSFVLGSTGSRHEGAKARPPQTYYRVRERNTGRADGLAAAVENL